MNLDYTLLTYNERLGQVEEALKGGRVNLEQLANYLLNAKDIANKKTLEYNIFTDRQLFEKRIKERSIGLINDYERLDILVEEVNFKKEKKQTITQKDIRKPVIRDYNGFIRACMEDKKELDYTEQRRLERLMSGVRYDMKLAKDELNRTIYFKHVMADSTENNIDWINLDNKDHILALLKYQSSSLDTWLGCVSFSLREIIESIQWTKKQWDILQLWCVEDYTQEYIGEMLWITKPAVNQYLDVIATKIVDEYIKQYEEYKYTYWVKGKYKRCSKCGENKLVREFSPDKRNKDRLHSFCKTCRKCK